MAIISKQTKIKNSLLNKMIITQSLCLDDKFAPFSNKRVISSGGASKCTEVTKASPNSPIEYISDLRNIKYLVI